MRKEFLDSPLSRLTDSKCRFYIAKKNGDITNGLLHSPVCRAAAAISGAKLLHFFHIDRIHSSVCFRVVVAVLFEFINPLHHCPKCGSSARERAREKESKWKRQRHERRKLSDQLGWDNQRRPHQWQLILSDFYECTFDRRASSQGENISKRARRVKRNWKDFSVPASAAAKWERINIQ